MMSKGGHNVPTLSPLWVGGGPGYAGDGLPDVRSAARGAGTGAHSRLRLHQGAGDGTLGAVTNAPIRSAFDDATVLITGGTGSFGRAFTAWLLANHEPHSIRVLSRDEAKHDAMRRELSDPRLRHIIADVRNLDRMRHVLDGVDIVIHAAAMKVVPACEDAPDEAVTTNVLGTLHILDAAVENQVKRVVFLSTDKAPAPDTFYGITKLAAERLTTWFNVVGAKHGTRFASTRYGNVQGSAGSVVPRFKAQLAAGQPFTITHPDMTRFWMQMDHAVALVAFAVENMRGGEIFVPKLPAIRIGDLCEALCPGHPTVAIGIRDCEKMHEVLITPEEVRRCWDVAYCYTIEPTGRSWTDDTSPPAGKRMWDDYWRYTSDAVRRLTVAELRELVR